MIVVALIEVRDHTLKRCQADPPSTSEERNDNGVHIHVTILILRHTNESESLRFRCRLFSLSLSALSATVKSSPAGTGPVCTTCISDMTSY